MMFKNEKKTKKKATRTRSLYKYIGEVNPAAG